MHTRYVWCKYTLMQWENNRIPCRQTHFPLNLVKFSKPHWFEIRIQNSVLNFLATAFDICTKCFNEMCSDLYGDRFVLNYKHSLHICTWKSLEGDFFLCLKIHWFSNKGINCNYSCAMHNAQCNVRCLDCGYLFLSQHFSHWFSVPPARSIDEHFPKHKISIDRSNWQVNMKEMRHWRRCCEMAIVCGPLNIRSKHHHLTYSTKSKIEVDLVPD